MKKLLATIAIFFMCVSTSVMGSQTPSKDDIENTINKISYYQMNTVKNPTYGSVGGEWTVFGLARCGNINDEYIEKEEISRKICKQCIKSSYREQRNFINKKIY